MPSVTDELWETVSVGTAPRTTGSSEPRLPIEVEPGLTPAETEAVRELLEEARLALGLDLREVRLFGSRARGEGHPDSDLDLAFLVTPQGRKLRRVIHDLAWEGLLRHGIPLAPLVIEEGVLEELRQRERLIASDLDREGIVLWRRGET